MQTDELLIFASEKVPLQDALFIPTHVTDLLLAKQNFPLAFFFFTTTYFSSLLLKWYIFSV